MRALRDFPPSAVVGYIPPEPFVLRNGWRIVGVELDIFNDELIFDIHRGEPCLVLAQISSKYSSKNWATTLLLVRGHIIAYLEHENDVERIWDTNDLARGRS